jgi:hypothetical protein
VEERSDGLSTTTANSRQHEKLNIQNAAYARTSTRQGRKQNQVQWGGIIFMLHHLLSFRRPSTTTIFTSTLHSTLNFLRKCICKSP